MSGMAFLALGLVAIVAGFVYNWLVPQVSPMLPATVSNNLALRSLATGVFILVALAVAHLVTRMVVGRKAKV